MKTTVIHHSADYDGIFCREIARQFLPEADLIGWDFGDRALPIPSEGPIYVLDLPVDAIFGMKFGEEGHLPWLERVVWIDHHGSSIRSHNRTIAGYRIDGVSACRLAWQWFTHDIANRVMGDSAYLPQKQEYLNRAVNEPAAVRLAGEYDVWDKRDPRAEAFQYGLRSRELAAEDWAELLSMDIGGSLVDELVETGQKLQAYQQRVDAGIVKYRSFTMKWQGLRFIALNTARCNSLTFAALDVPEVDHDALMGFFFDGKQWKVSLYHARHRKDIDLAAIAVQFGGGGHKGACGFTCRQLPFPT